MSSPFQPLTDANKEASDNDEPHSPLYYYENGETTRSPLSPVDDMSSEESREPIEISSDSDEIPTNRHDPSEKENQNPNEISSTTSDLSPEEVHDLLSEDEDYYNLLGEFSSAHNSDNAADEAADQIIPQFAGADVSDVEEYDPGEYIPPQNEFKEDKSLKRKRVPISMQAVAYKKCKTDEERIMYVRDRCIDFLKGNMIEGKDYLQGIINSVIEKENPSKDSEFIVFFKDFMEGEVNQRKLNGLFLYFDNILNATIFDKKEVKRLKQKGDYMVKANLIGGDFKIFIKIWDQKMKGKLYKNVNVVDWLDWNTERFSMDSYNDYFFEEAVKFCKDNKSLINEN